MERRKNLSWAGIAVLAASLFLSGSQGSAAAGTDPAEIMKKAHLRLYYPGDDFRATVTMTLKDAKGKERVRKFIMLRKDLEEGGRQKYYTYFLEPNDVRRTGFMVWKEPEKDDARWIYVPAIDLVRRISASDKGSSFVGSDFSYEDVSGRHWTEDKHRLLRTEAIDGEDADVIESTPRERDAFAKKITWVSVDRMVPLKEEYYNDKGELERTFRAEAIAEIDGHLTVTRRSMRNEKKGHTTIVEFTNVRYGAGISDDLFTERYLKAPPAEAVTP